MTFLKNKKIKKYFRYCWNQKLILEPFGIAVWGKKSMIMSLMVSKNWRSRLITMIWWKKILSKKGKFHLTIILKKTIEAYYSHYRRLMWKKKRKHSRKKGWLLIKYFFVKMIYLWQREDPIISIIHAIELRAHSVVSRKMII